MAVSDFNKVFFAPFTGSSVFQVEDMTCNTDRTSSSECLPEQSLPEEYPEIIEYFKLSSLIKPFEPLWSFGYNANIPIINLTHNYRKEIFYVASNFGVFYDYEFKEQFHVEGHKNMICSTSCDSAKRYLVTSDLGEDSLILIWNSDKKQIVSTIFDPYKNGAQKVQISEDAKYLVTLGQNDELNWQVDFWLWTLGKDKSDDSFVVNENVGKPKSIRFHPNKSEFFMIVFESTVYFLTWENEKLSDVVIPEINPKTDIGKFTDATYVPDSHESFVGTNKGVVAIFRNSIFTKEYKKENLNNTTMIYVSSIKLTNSITWIRSIDYVIVIGEANGDILFFDKYLKLLYWLNFSLDYIEDMAFECCPKTLKEYEDIANDYIFEICHFQDRSEEIEELKKKLSLDATLEQEHFLMRDFFVSCRDGNIYQVDFVNKRCNSLFYPITSPVVSIDLHPEKPYLLVAYEHGQLSLYNYIDKERVMGSGCLITNQCILSSVKYSSNGHHLACGKSNGDLWILEPILLKPKLELIKVTCNEIQKICFSSNSLQMAFYDSNMTVYAFVYDTQTSLWLSKGKIRAHYKKINDMLFHSCGPYHLYTIGDDRYIIKYNNSEFDNNQDFAILTRDRIEQRDIPVSFIYYPKSGETGYFLVVDDKFKYKMINEYTMMTVSVILGPSFGCFQNSPVCKMQFLPDSNSKYMIFMNKTHIGLHLLPINGNPYKFVANLGHPTELLDFRVTSNGRYFFTIGKNDQSVLMWSIDVSAVERMYKLSGPELDPYYCLIEGGKNGWLFQEIQDLFYYTQILQQGENSSYPRVVCDYINIVELPDLCRACGFYPTEFEIENLLTDIKYRDYDSYGGIRDRISFCDFVRLFINHRPAHGIEQQDLQRAFKKFTSTDEEDSAKSITKEDFISKLTTYGESFPTANLHKCLSILLSREDYTEESDFSFLNDEITYSEFTEDILGIDMDNDKE